MFIPTIEHGYIAMDSVAKIRHTRDGKYALISADGEVLGTTHRDPLELTVTVIPARAGEWEQIMALGDGHYTEWASDPVLAWAVTMDGSLRPITPMDLGGFGAINPVALRRCSHDTVYAEHDGTCETADDWLKSITRKQCSGT